MPMIDSPQQYPESVPLSPRFPVRWRWTMLVGSVVALAIVVLSMIIMDIERTAWLENLDRQATMQVDRLGEALKIPVTDVNEWSRLEIEASAKDFLAKVPSALGIYILPARGKALHYGDIGAEAPPMAYEAWDSAVQQLVQDDLWYAKKLVLSNTTVGVLAVRYSEAAWEDLSGDLALRLTLAAIVVVVLSGALIYWVTGRLSEPLEMLAGAAYEVAQGNYDVQLPVRGNDELSDATIQFNLMVQELAHKEQIKGVFGRYLNPKLVNDVFEGGVGKTENRRQEVTVLFADMVGFTSFSENTETEEIVDVLNKHFEVFHGIIDYFGGHVDKYIGDAVMAVFNHPKEDEDHARHAAMAAIAMTRACRKLGVLRSNGEPISFRVGLNLGEAIVGNIGAAERLEYTVIGNTVNVASRMGGLGGGGEVVMPRTTFVCLGEGFEYDAMGDMAVKGVSQPIHCGKVRAVDEEVQQKIAHAIALVFDLTLPSDVRQVIGDLES